MAGGPVTEFTINYEVYMAVPTPLSRNLKAHRREKGQPAFAVSDRNSLYQS